MSVAPLDLQDLLKEHGLRSTPGRVALLAILRSETRPLSATQIEARLAGEVDRVTVYRTLETLREARIIARVELGHDHAHYELIAGRDHHHHAICRDCGHIEDIEVSHARHPETEALKEARGFSSIDSYSLEFFGLCKTCA